MQPLHVDPVDLQLQRAYLLGLDHAVLQQHKRTRLNQCGGFFFVRTSCRDYNQDIQSRGNLESVRRSVEVDHKNPEVISHFISNCLPWYEMDDAGFEGRRNFHSRFNIQFLTGGAGD